MLPDDRLSWGSVSGRSPGGVLGERVSTGDRDIDVSVVLPVYNEKGHLRQEIDRISASLDVSEYSYELVIVDDGSTDGSLEELRRIDGIRLISFPQNRGSGSSRRAGTRAARGRVVVWTDVDMTYPNGDIPLLVKELEGADQVVGARTSEQGTHRLLRVPAKFIIRRIAQYLAKTKIPDLNSGYRAFRRDVALQYLHMLPAGFSCVTTMTMAFLANGYSVKYVPIEYNERAGSSKFHWYADTRRYAQQVLRLIFTFNPMRVFGPLGSLLLAVGFVKLGFDTITKEFRIPTNTVLLLFMGFQLLSIGLLADVVARSGKSKDFVEPATR
jgi:glycosyltransferase involved in cell wall biosynthesis